MDNSTKEKYQSIIDELVDTYIKKNADYGDSVGESFKKYGITSALVRLEDKLNRLKSLTKNKEQLVLDESFEDTLLDLVNYAGIYSMETMKEWLELKDNSFQNPIIKKVMLCVVFNEILKDERQKDLEELKKRTDPKNEIIALDMAISDLEQNHLNDNYEGIVLQLNNIVDIGIKWLISLEEQKPKPQLIRGHDGSELKHF